MKNGNELNDFEYKAILGSFIPNRLQLTINEDEIGMMYSNEHLVELKRELTIVHEKMHYYQSAMTGYGQDAWNLYRQLVACVLDNWISATNNMKYGRVLPIVHLINDSIDGLRNAVTINIIGKDTLRLMNLINKCPNCYKSLKDVGNLYSNNDFEICPTIVLNNEEYRVNGVDIIEAHAKYLEGYYIQKILNIDKDYVLDRNVLPKEYYYIYDWFINTLGEEYYLDFPIICDLSLQTEYKCIIKTEDEWHAIHPAWRFVKLTEALKKGIVNRFISEEDIINRYNDYSEKLLEYCGYISLDDNINRMKKRYCFRCDTCDKLELEKRMEGLLTLKDNNRWVSANPFISISKWIELNKKYNPPIIKRGDTIEIIPNDGHQIKNVALASGIIAENIMEIHLQALASQILGYKSEYLLYPNDLQCGYSYYGIKRGCAYQENNRCTGEIDIDNGELVGFTIDSDGNANGCSFEMFLRTTKINTIKNIAVKGYNKKMPSYEKLNELAKALINK